MALPSATGLIAQTCFLLIDLWCVAQAGTESLAGVSAAVAVTMLAATFMQVLSVGTVSLISRGIGAGDAKGVRSASEASLAIAAGCAVLAALLIGCFAQWFMSRLAASPAAAAAGTDFLHSNLAGLSIQFLLTSMAAVMQAHGVTKPTMLVRLLLVILNAILAPVLVLGWGTGYPFGAAGAGLASSLATGIAAIYAVRLFKRHMPMLSFSRFFSRFDARQGRQLLLTGIPAGAELLVMFALNVAMLDLVRNLGDQVQAALGIGSRVIQTVLIPALAVASAVPVVAGQNLGAGRFDRVRQAVIQAVLLLVTMMLFLFVPFRIWPEVPAGIFTKDPSTVQAAAEALRILSFNFLTASIVVPCAGLFQALGKVGLSLVAVIARFTVFIALSMWLAHRPGYVAVDVWHVAVVAMTVQAAIAAGLALHTMRHRLSPMHA